MQTCLVSLHYGLRITCLMLIYCEIVYVQQEKRVNQPCVLGKLLDVKGMSPFPVVCIIILPTIPVANTRKLLGPSCVELNPMPTLRQCLLLRVGGGGPLAGDGMTL